MLNARFWPTACHIARAQRMFAAGAYGLSVSYGTRVFPQTPRRRGAVGRCHRQR